MTVHRQQTRHRDLTIIRANEHFHHCSGGHFKIFPLYQVNTEGDFLRRRKETLFIMPSDWCCSVSMMWVQIPSREEQKFDSYKI
jgi:hypothetical protein